MAQLAGVGAGCHARGPRFNTDRPTDDRVGLSGPILTP